MVAFATAEIYFHAGCGVLTKEIIGKSARGLLNYIGNPKKTGGDKPFHTNFSGSSPRDIAREFSVLRKLKPNLSRAVAHIIVSVPEIGDDIVLWRQVVEETLKNKGYGDCLFASYLHKDTENRHAHIFVSRIYINPKTGKTEVVSDSKNFERNIESSRRVEKALGISSLVEKPIEERPYSSSTKHKAERRESRLLSEKPRSESTKPERKIVTTEYKYAEIAELAKKSLEKAENQTEWREDFERRLGEAGLPGAVEFHHRGEEVSGWSLLFPGGTSVKGSSISRALGFGQIQKQLLANAEEARARRRRTARAGETMQASITLASLARPSAQTALGQAPGPLAGPGVKAPGFRMVRQEAEGREFFQYLDDDGGVAFQDVPDAGVLLFSQDDDAVLAAVRLAVERHGPELDCAGAALQNPDFRRRLIAAACAAGAVIHPFEREIAEHRQALAVAAEAQRKAAPRQAEPALDFLNLAAANDGEEDDDGVDPAAGAASGGAVGASVGATPSAELLAAARGVLASQRLAGLGREDAVRRLSEAKAGAEATEQGEEEGDFVVEALRDLGESHEAEVARLDALAALGLGIRLGGVVAGSPEIPSVPSPRDLDARLLRARQVKTLVELLPAIPTEAQAARMSVAELAGVDLLWRQLGPVRDWASATAERHEREGYLGRGNAQALALASAEANARAAGGTPMATEVTRLAAVEVRAKHEAAKKAFSEMGLGARAAEAVSGRRAAEISTLEEELARSERASVRARRAFEESEAGKQAALEIQKRQAVYWAEREAMAAPFVGHLAASLVAILAKLARWVAAAVRRESKDDQDRQHRERLVEEARLAAGGGGAAASDDEERARVRRDLGRGG